MCFLLYFLIQIFHQNESFTNYSTGFFAFQLPLMERAGRRALLMYPSFIMIAAMLLMIPAISLSEKSAFWSYGSIVFMLVYILGFALGLGRSDNCTEG